MPTFAIWIDTVNKEVDLDEPDCEISDVLNASMAAAEAMQSGAKTLVVLVRDERTGRLYEAECTRNVTISKITELPPVKAASIADVIASSPAPAPTNAPTV